MYRRLLPLLLLAGVAVSWAAEVLPPAPSRYVNDEAGVIAPALLAQLNARAAEFEKRTSNQIVAVVYPKLPEGASLEDYAQNLYHAWRIGTKKNSNGILILVFTRDRKIRIQPGYGLEGALPDALCSRIVRETMAPAFRSGNYGAGLSAGIAAVMQATKGEYKGGSEGRGSLKDLLFSPLGFFLLVLAVLLLIGRNRREVGPGGISPGAAAATGFFLGGSGGWGGSGGGGGDSGGFSGGGGDSGGGGSSGDW
jgi:uncharacterized protein